MHKDSNRGAGNEARFSKPRIMQPHRSRQLNRHRRMQGPDDLSSGESDETSDDELIGHDLTAGSLTGSDIRMLKEAHDVRTGALNAPTAQPPNRLSRQGPGPKCPPPQSIRYYGTDLARVAVGETVILLTSSLHPY